MEAFRFVHFVEVNYIGDETMRRIKETEEDGITYLTLEPFVASELNDETDIGAEWETEYAGTWIEDSYWQRLRMWWSDRPRW